MGETNTTNGTDTKRWAAVITRDASADGSFYYAVKTTGVYCRPSCRSRIPNRGNVQFFDTRAAAERAGFRACKRCSPDGPGLAKVHAVAIAAACRQIRDSGQMPTVHSLAKMAGMSPFHFHRVFKKVTGLTPKGYKNGIRNERLRTELRKGKRVTDAIYDAGFNSNNQFRASVADALGMKAKDYRAGGNGNVIDFGVGECWLGTILVAASRKGICAILLGEDAKLLTRDLQRRFPKADLRPGDARFRKLLRKAIAFVEQPGESGVELPLDLRGTVFQQKVWAALRGLTAGDTSSYSDIARRIGRPEAVRAVAGAIAANPIAVAVPCHRVLRADGSLCGYRWGTERKQLLLKREKNFLRSDKERATTR